ncbi:MAG TPA: hypothetical protein VJ570_09450 [Holophagaceae bacterium]|nr:hypothetical protein [Holophagaceae bacterium]
MSNYDRLVEAGLINPSATTGYTQADIDKVNSLTSDEVDHLISVKDKLGADFLTQHSNLNQSFFVF